MITKIYSHIIYSIEESILAIVIIITMYLFIHSLWLFEQIFLIKIVNVIFLLHYNFLGLLLSVSLSVFIYNTLLLYISVLYSLVTLILDHLHLMNIDILVSDMNWSLI